jgi:hypothetical protein
MPSDGDNYKYNKVIPFGCLCTGKEKIVSEICGCINVICDFNTWECSKCKIRKRYKSWIIGHYNYNHKST